MAVPTTNRLGSRLGQRDDPSSTGSSSSFLGRLGNRAVTQDSPSRSISRFDKGEDSECRFNRFQSGKQLSILKTLPDRKNALPKDEFKVRERREADLQTRDVTIHSPKEATECHCETGFIRVTDQSVLLSLCSSTGVPSGDRRLYILDHYQARLLGVADKIGMTLFMNGINVSTDEFRQYNRTIYSQLEKRTVVLGLYNATQGIPGDIIRAAKEKAHIKTLPVKMMGRLLKVIARRFYASNQSSHKCLFVVHSEGSLILHEAIHRLKDSLKPLIQRNCCIITLGSARPIPDRYGVSVINLYSSKDFASGFGAGYGEGYTIRVVEAEKHDSLGHAFLSPTYQKHLRAQIDQLARTIGLV